MSLSALLTTVRDFLRNKVPLDDGDCEVMLDGQPLPGMGDQFVSVHSASWQSAGPIDDGIREEYAVTCTVTKRITGTPRRSFAGELLLDNFQGIEQLARKVMVTVHNNYDLLHETMHCFPDTDKIINPLVWLGTDAKPRLEGVDWIYSDAEVTDAVVLVLGIYFGKAERVQAIPFV